jgi:hypothetical protein
MSHGIPPPLPPRLWKMVSLDVLHCCFVHLHVREILKTYSESSFSGGLVPFQLARPILSCVIVIKIKKII